MTGLTLVVLLAVATVVVPVRPTSMMTDSTYFPASGDAAETPVLSPHVAYAEMTSNSTWSRGRCVSATITAEPASTTEAPIMITEIAMRSTESGMVRKNAITDWSPRASARIARNTTASVVTLIPPAVDAEPPPANIMASVSSRVTWEVSGMSTRLNPPERIITDAKNPWKIRSGTDFPPRVSGLFHSTARNSTHASSSRMAVVTTVSLALRFQRLKRKPTWRSTRITGKPREPMITPTHTGSRMSHTVGPAWS